MIFSVGWPQYFISHTKSQRLLGTRHQLSCEKVNLHNTLVMWAWDPCEHSIKLSLTKERNQTRVTVQMYPSGRGVHSEVLYREALPQGPTPYPFIYHFLKNGTPFTNLIYM